MNIKKVAKMKGWQDGAIYGSEMFRFDHKGNCCVYNTADLMSGEVIDLTPIAEFRLDRADVIAPHSNAVCFGCDFYEEGDSYPLLYANIYNNYASQEDKMIGVCLVYRIQRTENEFRSTLVQIIEIGFCEDARLWKKSSDGHGVRPYGNFLVDNDSRSYWAFVMRDEKLGTRYFRFDLPSLHDGEIDNRYSVRRVVLRAEDIKEYFDCSYHYYLQGATLHKGKIYSTEGFGGNDRINRPAIRIIDLSAKKETYIDLVEQGQNNEAEFISFYGDECFYSDGFGNVFKIDF